MKAHQACAEDQFRKKTDATITAELGPAALALAVDQLLRFIATHETVFERVHDPSDHVHDVYYQAIVATDDLVQNLTEPEADLLPN